MRESEYRTWLEAQGYDAATVSTQIARAKRIDQSYGDLDEQADGGLLRLQQELAYSRDDERAQKPSPARFPIDGSIYNNLASYRKTIDYYRQFLESTKDSPDRHAHAAALARLTRFEIEATMDDCDTVGVDAFLRAHGFVRPSNWLIRPPNDARYPAKAVAAIAIGKLPGEEPIGAKAFFGGFGESQAFKTLRDLGYAVEGKDAGLSTDAALLARFDRGRPGFKRVRQTWGGDRTAIFCGIVRLIHERGFDWWHIEQEPYQLRFGWNEPGRSRGKPLGMIYGERTGPALTIFGDRGLGPDRTLTMTADDLAATTEIFSNSVEALKAIGGGNRAAYWPDELTPEKATPTTDIVGAQAVMVGPTNLILYGPPGTGKTFATASEAVRLCGERVPDDRAELMELYRSLVRRRRIAFTTFHQSYSYEDFVQGLRPVTGAEDGDIAGAPAGFSLKPHDGVFKEIADLASANRGRTSDAGQVTLDPRRRIFKMSLGRARAAEDDHIYQQAIDGNYVVLGYGGDVDWSDPGFDRFDTIKARWQEIEPGAHGNDPNIAQIFALRANMEIGSYVVISDGNLRFRAIGEITGPYEFVEDATEYRHRRRVRWLWHTDTSLSHDQIYAKIFSQVSAYQLNGRLVNWEAMQQIVGSAGDASGNDGMPEPYVLIIDEINRANISKIFGELITLLEPDKRLGMPNALTVRLPHSPEPFGVPANLHIIGTMNTADRSIALLDTALRRRFEFRELMPDPSVLNPVEGVDVAAFLTLLNERIEYLFDREHQIGHAYFIGCDSRAVLDEAMRRKVIPLLAEYFHEDWGKVAAVLGDAMGERFLERQELKAPPGLEDEDGSRWRWLLRSPFADDAYSAVR